MSRVYPFREMHLIASVSPVSSTSPPVELLCLSTRLTPTLKPKRRTDVSIPRLMDLQGVEKWSGVAGGLLQSRLTSEYRPCIERRVSRGILPEFKAGTVHVSCEIVRNWARIPSVILSPTLLSEGSFAPARLGG